MTEINNWTCLTIIVIFFQFTTKNIKVSVTFQTKSSQIMES